MQRWTQEGYLAALRFAAEAHARQTVPGTEWPYLVHVTSVAMEVVAALQTEPEHDQELAVQCALLHDVVEDTQTTVEQLRGTFGSGVANGVSALSKNKTLPNDQQLGDSLLRIREQGEEVWMVKLADRITNLQPPPASWRWERIARYRDEAITIHSSLKNASRVLAARLAIKIEGYGAGRLATYSLTVLARLLEKCESVTEVQRAIDAYSEDSRREGHVRADMARFVSRFDDFSHLSSAVRALALEHGGQGDLDALQDHMEFDEFMSGWNDSD